MFVEETRRWAEEVFGTSRLGDRRLDLRLVRLACSLAEEPEKSISGVFKGDNAGEEGAYRFLRNRRVDVTEIAEAGFRQTAAVATAHTGVLVAAEDTTTLAFEHDVDGLGDLGGPANSRKKGLWVHSILLVDVDTATPLGLIEQQMWVRDAADRGKRHNRHERTYKEKESYKWERASRRVAERLSPDVLSRVVSACDREADIYEYLKFKQNEGQRFVVRATRARKVVGSKKSVIDEVAHLPFLGKAALSVPQRGGPHGRRARTAVLSIRGGTMTLQAPKRQPSSQPPLTCRVVYAAEENSPKGVAPLKWILLTSESADDLQEALTVLALYRLRWRVEDFHKAWKTGGTDVEGCRLQNAENIERLAVILAFIAVRILQLRELKEIGPERPVTDILTSSEWKILWMRMKKRKPPTKLPTIEWAYRAIATLGGWSDTKRTGRAGWVALWRGWTKLEDLVEGYNLAQSMKNIDM